MKLSDTDPLDPAVVECPFPMYAQLRTDAPVYRVPGRGWVLVSGYDVAVEVLKDSATFSSASGVGVPQGPDGQHPTMPGRVPTLLTADPPVHGHYRTVVNRAFSARRVAAMEEGIRSVANDLVDTFAATGTVELGHDYAVPLPLIVICDMLGLPRSDLRTFKQWSDGIASLGGLVSAERLAEIKRDNVAFEAYLLERIAECRREPRDDVMSDLIGLTFTAPDGVERPLSDPELLSILPQLLVAGNETTTSTITTGVKLLIEHPDQLQAVRDDRSLVPNLVEEVLRYEAPVQCHFRRATRDTVLHGVAIPAGTGVGVLYGSANRDDGQFPDGERFDVRRAGARNHLAFSQGIHFCVGAPLGRLEARVAFEVLLDRLDDLAFAPGRNDFTHVPSFTHRGLKQLWITYTAR